MSWRALIGAACGAVGEQPSQVLGAAEDGIAVAAVHQFEGKRVQRWRQYQWRGVESEVDGSVGDALDDRDGPSSTH